MQYLCYFILFCMFGNYWRCITRSLESPGKVPVKTPDFGSPKNSRKIQRIILRKISHETRRGEEASNRGQVRPPAAGPPRDATRARPWPLSVSPLACYYPLT